MDKTPQTRADPDPEEFLRALLAVSPEDAAEVRAEADEKAKPDAAATRPSSGHTE